MKILSVSNGTSVHVWKWAKYFVERGHEFHLISPLFTKREDLADDRVHLHQLPDMIPWAKGVSKLVNTAIWTVYIRKVIREVAPLDILEAHYIGVPAYLASSAGFRPLVLDAWGSDILILAKKPWYRMMIKTALKRADVVFCNSNTLRAGLESLDTDMRKVRKIYQGVDTTFFCPDKRPRRNIVISTRNLDEVYDVETTIRAVPLVLEHFPKTRFIIAGDGVDRKRLEKLTEEMGIGENVVFTGSVGQNLIRDWLKVSRVYVSTSRSDSTSVCMHEAMACGVPCVVSDLSGNREWVEDGVNGLLSNIGDSYDVADKIKRLLRSTEERVQFGELSRMKVVREADYMRNMELVEGYYEELIG